MVANILSSESVAIENYTDLSVTVSFPIFSESFSRFNYTNFDFSNGSNITTDNNGYIIFPSYLRTTTMVLCIIIMCLGVIGNVMVPIVIFKTKDMRNSTNIFLVNLSTADLLVLLICTPTVLVEVNSQPEVWVLGKEMCKAVPFVELTVAHASVLTILAISFERYYAICKPLKASYVCTKARASIICLLSWFIAAVFTSPILGLAEYHHIEYMDGSNVPACHTLANTFWPALYFLSSVFVFFILPLIILVVLYLLIAKNLIYNNMNLITSNIDNYMIRARKQVIFMLGTVIIIFFLCLIPFRAFTLWIILVPTDKFLQLGYKNYYNILFFCRIMLYINSAINPIIYNLMSSKFRSGVIICSEAIRNNDTEKLPTDNFSMTATSRCSIFKNLNESYVVHHKSGTEVTGYNQKRYNIFSQSTVTKLNLDKIHLSSGESNDFQSTDLTYTQYEHYSIYKLQNGTPKTSNAHENVNIFKAKLNETFV